MKYVGSKQRLSKELVPIIESYINEGTTIYIEPFVGGANMIDKINFNNKIGIDSHKELIALLKYTQNNYERLPFEIPEDEYIKVRDSYRQQDGKYDDWYYGLVGFCATFGAKWFGGYARGFKADRVTPRNLSNEAIRNLQKQAPQLKNIKFICDTYQNIPLEKISNATIYCDPPYAKTTGYSGSGDFNHSEFWEWVRKASQNNTVLVSEYNAPEDFEIIWEKGLKSSLGSGINQQGHKKSVERLFKLKNNS